MTISITDLLTPQTSTQIRTTMVNSLVALGIPADQWTPGGALSLILTVVSVVLAGFTTIMAAAIGSGFLPTATGGWLTLLAYYVYGVTRPPATAATGPLTLSNSGGGSYNYSAGMALFLDPVNGQTYTNSTAIALAPLGTQTIQIACTAVGAVGSAPPGEVSVLVTQMLGVTVGNPSSVVGTDAASDGTLRQLCMNSLGAQSVRGPRSAYGYAIQVAQNAVTGAPVDINRQTVSPASHTGIVTIIVAAPDGIPDPNDVDGVETSIESGVPGLSPPFSGARPDCVTVDVYPATAVPYGPTLTVWALQAPGLDAFTVAAEIGDGLTEYLENYPIGGVGTDKGQGIWASGVNAQVQASTSATIVEVEGATDAQLGTTDVPIDEITVSVRLVVAS